MPILVIRKGMLRSFIHAAKPVMPPTTAINQIFSLLDPLIFRHIIDSYATRYREYSSPQFIRGVGLLLAAAVGVALASRIAKNFTCSSVRNSSPLMMPAAF
jgi:hypothetical protein